MFQFTEGNTFTPFVEQVATHFNMSTAGKCYLSAFEEAYLNEHYKTVKSSRNVNNPGKLFLSKLTTAVRDKVVKPNWRLYFSLLEQFAIPKERPEYFNKTQAPKQTDVFQQPNLNEEAHETVNDSLGSFEAVKSKTSDKFTTNIEYNSDGTYTRPSWTNIEKVPLIPVRDLPPSSKLSEYTIQQLADEMKNWQKILDSHLKEAKTIVSEPNLAKYISTNEKIAFVTSQIKAHMTEFVSRPPEEQSEAR